MKRNKWGLHGPNHDPTNIEAMTLLGCDNYTVLAKWEQVGMIRKARPNALILLRPYWGPTNLDEDPVEVAYWCDNIVDSLWQYSHHVTAMNEANIEWGGFGPHPGRVEGWKRLNEWMLRWTEEFLKRRPDAIIHWPALSPGWGDDPNVMDPPGMWYCRESIEACHILDVHCYWSEGQHLSRWYGKRYELVHELFPSKFLFVSECAPNDYRRPGAAREVTEWFQELYKYPYMLGGTAFTWMWNPGPDRQYHIIWNKPHIVEAMRSADKPLIEVPTNWEFEEEENGMGAEIKVKMNGSIQTMDLEEYVRGVVPREAIASWGDLPNGMEVLKAQAVAARTYAAFAIFHPRHGAAAVCTTTHCQVWTSATDPRTDRAVQETAGAFVTEDGDIIQTQYVSRCGMPQCPECRGKNGHNGKQWPGRMCQWGARFMAVDQGKTWREILKFYYPQGDWGDGPSNDWIPFSIRGVVKVKLGGFELEIPVEADLEVSEEANTLPL